MRWFYEIWVLGLSETHISTIMLNKTSCLHSLGTLSCTNRRWGHVSPNSHMFSQQRKDWEDWRVSRPGHSCCEERSRLLSTSSAGWGFRGEMHRVMFSYISHANGRIKASWAGECPALPPGIKRTIVPGGAWPRGGMRGPEDWNNLQGLCQWEKEDWWWPWVSLQTLSLPGRQATGSVLAGVDS